MNQNQFESWDKWRISPLINGFNPHNAGLQHSEWNEVCGYVHNNMFEFYDFCYAWHPYYSRVFETLKFIVLKTF